MAATFQFSQTYGAAPGTPGDIGDGSGGNYFNFKNIDDATPGNYGANPISAGNNSFEVYLRGHFTGTFNSISNLKFWASSLILTGYGTGASIKASVQGGGYATPTTTPNADSAVPTTEGGALAPTYAANFSQYVRLQLATAADASPGDGGTTTFTLKYDET